MQAFLIVTSLDETEWQGCRQRMDYNLHRARVCGRKIYSHVAILFSNLHKSSACASRHIIFESLQEPRPSGKLGFSPPLDDPSGWYAQWRNPVVYFYPINPTKIDPMELFRVCEFLANSDRTYDWGWAVQAVCCPFLPCAACKCNCNSRSQSTTNCVGAVAICLAAAIDRDALRDRSRVRDILKLKRFHPELFLPSEMLSQLHEAELILATPLKELKLSWDKNARENRPLPVLTMIR